MQYISEKILIKWCILFFFFTKVLESVSSYFHLLGKRKSITCCFNLSLELCDRDCKFYTFHISSRGSSTNEKMNVSFTYQIVSICFTMQMCNNFAKCFSCRSKLHHSLPMHKISMEVPTELSTSGCRLWRHLKRTYNQNAGASWTSPVVSSHCTYWQAEK